MLCTSIEDDALSVAVVMACVVFSKWSWLFSFRMLTIQRYLSMCLPHSVCMPACLCTRVCLWCAYVYVCIVGARIEGMLLLLLVGFGLVLELQVFKCL